MAQHDRDGHAKARWWHNLTPGDRRRAGARALIDCRARRHLDTLLILSPRNFRRALRLLRDQGPRAVLSRAGHYFRSWRYMKRAQHPFLASPPIAEELLGMTSREEQAYLRWYAKEAYDGDGEIVDLGSWMGSSTVPLALGLQDNPRVRDKAQRIHAYDIFTWEDWMDGSVAGSALAGRYRPGDSFLDEFRRRTARWEPLIETVPGDLTRLGWESAEPIEFLFNDASKSETLAAAILRNFYPYLIAGKSIVVEQDFAHYYTSWVHLVRYRLREWFEPVFHVPFSGSAVFRCTGAVPREVLEEGAALDSFSDDDIEAAFAASLDLVGEEMKPNVLAARAMLWLHRGDPTRARHELSRAHQEGYAGLDLIRVEREIEAAHQT